MDDEAKGYGRALPTRDQRVRALNGLLYYHEVTKEEVITELMRVRGIGEEMAEELYEKGIRSISDVVNAPHISERIRLLAKYADELKGEVTVEEAARLTAFFEALFIHSALTDPSLRSIEDVIMVGAHRRGSPSVHDVDILVVYSDELLLKKSESTPLPGVRTQSLTAIEAQPGVGVQTRALTTIEVLAMPGVRTQSLTANEAQPGVRTRALPAIDGESSVVVAKDPKRGDVSIAIVETLKKENNFLGTLVSGDWKLEFLWRRNRRVTEIDVRLCPSEERGAALLHTTGPAAFNILLRKRAIRYGMTLSEHGLFLQDGTLVHSATEEGIFSSLHLPFIHAVSRDSESSMKLVAATETTPLP